MKIRIIKPCGFKYGDFYREFGIGTELEIEDSFAENLIKIGHAEAIEKQVDRPPKDKMIKQPKKKKIMGGE